jgi:hypothetical protein
VVAGSAVFMVHYQRDQRRRKAKLDQLLLLRPAEKPTGSVGVMQVDLRLPWHEREPVAAATSWTGFAPETDEAKRERILADLRRRFPERGF